MTLVLVGTGCLLLLSLGCVAGISALEGERRAVRVALALAMTLSVASFAAAMAPKPIQIIAGAALAAALLAAVFIWFRPTGEAPRLGGRPVRRVDERDIMFARARLRPGTPEYLRYYEMRPAHRAGDDRTRALPGLLSLDAEKAEPEGFAAAKAFFEITEKLRHEVNGPLAEARTDASPAEWTTRLVALARELGAVDAGVTELGSYHVYTHIGRGTGTWGAPVELDHGWAVAFTVEMDHAAISHAPEAPVIEESARQYVALSRIAVALASEIRQNGWPARAHTDGNYRVIAPLVARDAGLGEIGRMGLLMTPRLGPRVRIGVVTTSLPLTPHPSGDDASVLDFCTVCKKCATNCPVGAIPTGDRAPIDQGLRWAIDSETCFRYWNVIGTDCAVCMRVCPYSHPDSAAHNVVRWAIRRSAGARRALLWADDLFYGRRP
jgi:ferredoxin